MAKTEGDKKINKPGRGDGRKLFPCIRRLRVETLFSGKL